MVDKLTQDEQERLQAADKALDELLECYRVEICHDGEGEYFFDVVRRKKPELKIV